MRPILRTAWYLTGPTAAGKTAVGIELAKRIDAEIVSLDSMAIYRRMNIGTAKPTAVERAAAPHHLIDLIEPAEEFSIAQYLAASEQAAVQIAQRGKQVLFVGGTALYLKALLRGLFSGPPADWKFRRELEELARIEGSNVLHERLRQVDPAAAAKLHANDVRRITRALEVHAATGKPISFYQQHFGTSRRAEECRVFVLNWPREQLEQRMRRRVDAMFETGLVDEVRQFMGKGGWRMGNETTFGRTARQAVGYREVIEYLRGERDLAATIELAKLRTRQFAKRQLTWFRGLCECRWIHVEEPLEPAATAGEIADLGAMCTRQAPP
ncbi:MAG: tRNA (adenosine(37)-N6)-dimethylallyltransferase MiaA [Pirellulales bacterium]|nr:tRNA (adenosine(37)-N6)-dimethylallyltransferase MiaA [Pirellulales bacterium]